MNDYFFQLSDGEPIHRFSGNIELHIGQKLKIIDTYYKVTNIDKCLVILGHNQMTYPTRTEIFCTVEEIK
jgi:hypothetical protein